MKDLIARLIDCGVTRLTAVFLSRYYRNRKKEFERYVEAVEAETRVFADDIVEV